MGIQADNPIGNLKFYPVPPVPSGTDGARGQTATGPASFQNLLRKVTNTDEPEAIRSGGPSSAVKGRELLELTQRVKLQMNENLLRITSDTESEDRPNNSLMGGLSDIFSGGTKESPFPSIIRQGLSETDIARPQGLSRVSKKAVIRSDRPSGLELDGIIQNAAETCDVDPELIKGVIQAESNFNPNAISPKGAMGLMQLMPMTARELGVTDPMDPASNVMGGTRYLKKLLDRYDGSVPLALAAYNWGMGNLDSHRGRMPEETRNYVAKITRAYRDSTDAVA